MKRLLRKKTKQIRKISSKLGSGKSCNVCGKTFGHFLPYKGGAKALSGFQKQLKMVGSDLDNFGCVYCRCHDRERHLCFYFDKLGLWQRFVDSKVLHFAPEKNLKNKISIHQPTEYVKADLMPKSEDISPMDATRIPSEDNYFDVLIANHILEHIPEYKKALSEFYRVLKAGGFAILQTPYSRLLHYNFEDPGISTDEQRLYFYGQEDHVRVFGEREFYQSLQEAGFKLALQKHQDVFDHSLADKYGLNSDE